MNNPELQRAWQIIENTGTHLFLTGKAGTGKTTFLRNLKKESPKRTVIVAPTGIAAINAGGVTLHSFFQLPFLVKGKHTGFKCFDIHNCRKFSVDLEKPMVLHADGEYCGDVTHAEFRCLSGKLNILL